jgi:ankyrin repeat protein
MYFACMSGNLAIVRCLGREFGAHVSKADQEGSTPLYIAAQIGNLDVVRCLIEELGANVNRTRKNGTTPLMIAACYEHKKVTAYLLKHGADSQASAPTFGTAADISKNSGASDEQTAYLEAKTHCSNPACASAGIKKCTGCKEVRYCGQECQLAHWPAHKADCKAAAKNNDAKKD